MKIPLTQKHIDDGVKGSCGWCPAALAINDATGGNKVSVDPKRTCWGTKPNGHWKHCIDTPPAVREFLDRYDSGLPVEPFEFELEAA